LGATWGRGGGKKEKRREWFCRVHRLTYMPRKPFQPIRHTERGGRGTGRRGKKKKGKIGHHPPCAVLPLPPLRRANKATVQEGGGKKRRGKKKKKKKGGKKGSVRPSVLFDPEEARKRGKKKGGHEDDFRALLRAFFAECRSRSSEKGRKEKKRGEKKYPERCATDRSRSTS